MKLHRNGEFVLRTVQCEGPGDLNRGVTGSCDGALIAPGDEGDFGKAGGIQNVLAHLAVTAFVAAVAAAAATTTEPRWFSRAIKVNGAALDMESALDGMVRGAQGECNRAASG